ncbi:uncharacterized protein LOC125680920 [Ostrea edulis]|uniref:uncharacterized protein LOC125680920 n=1 Tax=Ostrea edulis TaxID=37623 RepID=UPI0024AF7D2E|nr:uncharacterized protein LOC125680920 [Ostrea edulis]
MDPVSSIYDDAENIEKLVASAKINEWGPIWRILGTPSHPKKSYLINCIPENRRWSILHQAIFWNNHGVVANLLQFNTCDKTVKAKEGTSEIGPDGKKSPEEVAEAFGHNELKPILDMYPYQLHDQLPVTFLPLSDGADDFALGLLRITLASYKTAFQLHTQEIPSFSDLLRDVYNKIDTSNSHWKLVRDKVHESVYVICHQTCLKIRECESKERFYTAIINTYTEEKSYLYDHLNTALRRQRQTDYRPTADDLALGPYVLMYQLLLLFWNKLHKERRVTYRRMRVSSDDLAKYQVGTKFAWMSFVSSSVELEKAIMFPTCGPTGDRVIVFTIDNSSASHWQPRNIEKYAQYMERERVYPAGAKFLVTKRTDCVEESRIFLKLL